MKLQCQSLALSTALLCVACTVPPERSTPYVGDNFIFIGEEGAVAKIPSDGQFPKDMDEYNCNHYYVPSSVRMKIPMENGAIGDVAKLRNLYFGFDEPNPQTTHPDAVCVMTPVGSNGFYVQQFRRIHLPNTSDDLSGYRVCKDPGEGVEWISDNLEDQETPCGPTGPRGCTACGPDNDNDGKPDPATGSVKVTSH